MTAYNLVIGEEYKDSQTGQKKTYWNKVGSAVRNENGEGFTLFINDQISISGRVCMFPKKDKADDQPQNIQ